MRRCQTIGVLGGGQLGRMLALAGYPLGLRIRFYDEVPDAPASQVGELVVGRFDDGAALERFARGLDAVTYEFENVPVDAAERLAAVVPVLPPPAALAAAQDRLSEKRLFVELGVPTTRFVPVDTREQLDVALRELGLPVVLKTRRHGYDGKGQAVVRTADDVEPAWAALGAGTRALIAEEFVAFDRELSVLAVRGHDGACGFYPLVENVHQRGILRLSRAPAADVAPALQERAHAHARAVMERTGYVGVLAIEFFERGGELIANEMAPRVHNSGHWTIEGACVSQFENHVRAVAGLPLGSCEARGWSAMVNIIGALPTEAATRELLTTPGGHLHLYGKEPRAGRKLGHVSLVAPTRDHAERAAARLLTLCPMV